MLKFLFLNFVLATNKPGQCPEIEKMRVPIHKDLNPEHIKGKWYPMKMDKNAFVGDYHPECVQIKIEQKSVSKNEQCDELGNFMVSFTELKEN